MLGRPGDQVLIPTAPPLANEKICCAGREQMHSERMHMRTSRGPYGSLGRDGRGSSTRAPTIVAGLTMRSKSSAVIAPESSADSRRVRPCVRVVGDGRRLVVAADR
jgi:hypothetical protein